MATIYVPAATMVSDLAVKKPLVEASWTTADIEAAIIEAETYVEGFFLGIGFTRVQLSAAPSGPVPVITQLVINYCRYVILRDIYSNNAPSESGGERYDKYFDAVTKVLEGFLPDKDGVIRSRLVDITGNLLSPAKDLRFAPGSNTLTASRMVTMDSPDHWRIDSSNADESVVGKKPGSR